jgi:DHA2 family multidrug resistance protein
MREALVLTFSDAYLAVALCFVVALVSVAFSRPFGLNVPPPDAH